MKTWADLTKDQKSFITRYLKRSPMDLFRKREKTETNRAIIAAYGDYDDVKAIFLSHADAIPDDYTERGPIDEVANAAHDLAIAGRFQEAHDMLLPCVNRAMQLRHDLMAEAEALRATVSGPMPEGLGDPQQVAVQRAVDAVLVHLRTELPTSDQMEQARTALAAHRRALADALATLPALEQARARFEQARRDGSAVIDATAGLDLAYMDDAPQFARLGTLKRQAEQLQGVMLSPPNDATQLETLAEAIDAFAAANEAQPLHLAALGALSQKLNDEWTAARTDVEAYAAYRLDSYTADPDYAEMQRLQGEMQADIAFISTMTAARIPSQVDTVRQRIAEAKRRSEEMRTLVDAAYERAMRAHIASKGAKPAHVDGVRDLQNANPEAAKAVMQALSRDTAILNGQAATPEFIRAETARKKGFEDEFSRQKGLAEAADRDIQTHRDTINRILPAYTQLEKKDKKGKLTAEEEVEFERLHEIGYRAQEARKAAEQAKQTAEGLRDAAARSYLDSDAKLDAAQTQRAMLDAITFGPLSKNAARPLPAGTVENVVKLFSSNPELAKQTCGLLSTAKDPVDLAETAVYLAGQKDAGLPYTPAPTTEEPNPKTVTMKEEFAQSYVQDLLKQAAYLGPEFSADAKKAIAAGVPYERNPDLPARSRDRTVQKMAQIRATQASAAMMKRTVDPTSGKATVSLDLGGAFQGVLDRQKFSVDGQDAASVMMNAEMDKLQAFFTDPKDGTARTQKAEEILNSVTAVPADPRAQKLLADSLGIDPADFNDPGKEAEIIAKTQQAILKAMCQPIAQGKVGSCFATAPLVNMRNSDPLAVMEMYRDIATTGKFNPKVGDPISAVTKLPPGDDPLQRSLEYSIAAASAQLESGVKRGRVNKTLRNGAAGGPSLKKLRREVPRAQRSAFDAELQRAINAGFTFTYDPTIAQKKVGGDGSSSKGQMRMVDRDTEAEITTQQQFIDYVKRKAGDAADKVGLDSTTKAKVLAYLDDPAFAQSMADHNTERQPWNMKSGGFGNQAGDVLFGRGGAKDSEDLVPKDDAASMEKRALDVLESIGGLGHGTDGMTMVSTGGIHAFNAVEPTGNMAALMQGDVKANIQSMLVKPGKDIAGAKLPVDRLGYMFDRDVAEAISWLKPPQDVADRAYAARPTVEMTPKEYADHLDGVLADAKTASIDRRLAKWEKDQKTPPSSTKKAEKRDKLVKSHDRWVTEDTQAALAEDLAVPEFVIADTNWGSAADHSLFVIAPDPLTGEARLWKKSVMGGPLKPMDDKWLKANWYKDE